MTESASASTLITQGSVTGTIQTILLANECTLALLNAPTITETAGVTVTQPSTHKHMHVLHIQKSWHLI